MNDTLDNSNQTNFETDYYSNYEENFNEAIAISQKSYTYTELVQFLFSEKILEKQIAALELKEIRSKNDAFILSSNLVGQDGKVREAVAFKLNDLCFNPKYKDYFVDERIFDIFLQGIMDINGNVCRLIIELTQIDEFSIYLSKKLPEIIRDILIKIEAIDSQSKQYIISKNNFQLYWSLEALFRIIKLINPENIYDIISKTCEFYDYTIREKTAKILTKIDTKEFKKIKEKLSNDENYYVRRVLI